MVDTPPCESLIELEDVLVTAEGSELALTGGDGQVIKADHLACHRLDSLVVGAWLSNQQMLQDEVKVFRCCQAAAFPNANQAAQVLAAAAETAAVQIHGSVGLASQIPG